VVFGDGAKERIPFPDPARKPIAERDFPDLVPIQTEHHKAAPVPSTFSQRPPTLCPDAFRTTHQRRESSGLENGRLIATPLPACRK
jgi:hypothetical protein